MPKAGPENTWEIVFWASDVEQSMGSVPVTKYARKVFSLVAVHHTPNATGWFAIRKYSAAGALERENRYVLGAFDILDLTNPIDSPLLTFEAGREMRIISGAPTSIQVTLSVYDIG